jgi:glycosyltransferase involved in cell wall biosynthesis
MLPTITTVIPCFNSASWVGRAIESVLDQSQEASEIIVIDDGSTDNSLAVIGKYERFAQIETGPNRGACAARNRGLALAKGRCITFLDADDYIEQGLFEGALAAILVEKADLAFARLVTETNKGRSDFGPPPLLSPQDLMVWFLQNGFITPCSTFWSTEFLRAIGGWSDHLRRYQDYEVVYRALSHSPRLSVIREGAGVSFQHSSAGRISFRHDTETVIHQAAVIRYIGECLQATSLPPTLVSKLMQTRSYRFWRETSRAGNVFSTNIARELYLEFGGHRHIGGLVHCTLASVLWLRAKEQISLKVHQFSEKLRGRIL